MYVIITKTKGCVMDKVVADFISEDLKNKISILDGKTVEEIEKSNLYFVREELASIVNNLTYVIIDNFGYKNFEYEKDDFAQNCIISFFETYLEGGKQNNNIVAEYTKDIQKQYKKMVGSKSYKVQKNKVSLNTNSKEVGGELISVVTEDMTGLSEYCKTKRASSKKHVLKKIENQKITKTSKSKDSLTK